MAMYDNDEGGLLGRLDEVCGPRVGYGRRWTLSRVCRDLDLVVRLQRCAVAQPGPYRSLVDPRSLALALWLFELAVACACQGHREFAPKLLAALPHVSGGAFEPLLAELLGADGTSDGAVVRRGAASAVVGGAR